MKDRLTESRDEVDGEIKQCVSWQEFAEMKETQMREAEAKLKMKETQMREAEAKLRLLQSSIECAVKKLVTEKCSESSIEGGADESKFSMKTDHKLQANVKNYHDSTTADDATVLKHASWLSNQMEMVHLVLISVIIILLLLIFTDVVLLGYSYSTSEDASMMPQQSNVYFT
mmetsp:Transcript_339/g.524  ORF Transcript_339/g.524 Transcript_339/m.524 type:complete len:172 (-) Transcript_339:138-653(-)